MAENASDAITASRLPQLQNLIKRDPLAYREEFEMQYRHFESELDIFRLRPTKDSGRFTDLLTFISHTAACYKDLCKDVPLRLLELVDTNAVILHPDVRAKLLQALMLMRSKQMLDPLVLIKLGFRLISIQDKNLRVTVKDYIVQDIKAMNHDKRNEKLNRRVQAFLFSVVADDESVTARKTVDILAELYRRRIWTDARTVNVLGSACVNKATRVMVAAINFFMGIESKMEDDDDDEKVLDVTTVNFHEHSKKTKKRSRIIKKQIDRNLKLKREKENKSGEAIPLFPAIQLLRDPQELAEKLFSKLKQAGQRFEIKLLIMNFISRLIGCHTLNLLSFYSYVQRYLTSHQQHVTQILAYLIQACHSLVPPEELLPTIKAIAYNFITDRCTNEVISVGINSVREILVRVPALLLEPDMEDFIQDIVQYGRKSHKSVMIAANGIINLVREQYPTLLKKANRGKFYDMTSVPTQYGEVTAREGVAGIELLDAYEKGELALDENGDLIDRDQMGAVGSDSEDDEEEGSEGGWESVSEGEKGEGGDDEEDEDSDDDSEEDSDEEGWEAVSDGGEEGKEGEGDGWESASDSDAEEMDVEEEEEEGSEAPDLVPAPAAKAPELSLDRRRILTSEDFELIDRLKAAYSKRMKDPRARSAAKKLGPGAHFVSESMENDEDEEGGGGDRPMSSFTVTPDMLAPEAKTHKSTKVDRMTKILEGRKEDKFDAGGHAGGLTNKEKLRKKNYIMVRKGKKAVANKSKESNSSVRFHNAHRKEQYGREKRKRRRT
jgi:protein SDA1